MDICYANPKIVDLTLTESDTDDEVELLSLQDRIARKQKPAPIKRATSTKLKISACDHQTFKPNSSFKKYATVSDSEDDEDNNPPKKKFMSSLSDSEGESNLKTNNFQNNEEFNNDEDDDELPSIDQILGRKKSSPVFSALIQPSISLVTNAYEESTLTTKASKVTTEPKQTTWTKKSAKTDKDLAKEERNKQREEKKRERELEKALKASEKEIQKSRKPEECLKGMKLIIDHAIIYEKSSEDLICALDDAELKYNIEDNPIPKSILWCKTVFDVTVEGTQVVKEEREELENTLVLFIQDEEFIKMVYASTQNSSSNDISLTNYVMNVKEALPQADITCVVMDYEKCIKKMKDGSQSNPEYKKLSKVVTKNAVEEALIEVQLQSNINFHFHKSMKELGELLARFSKAIAEAPQRLLSSRNSLLFRNAILSSCSSALSCPRREKNHQKSQAFSWYADADSSCPVKIGKDGSGLAKLWSQQIQQFNNVGPEIAEAVTAKYPSPRILLEAYERCVTKKEAENLLQDIVVRRNYGPLGTQRRIGPELSYKIHLFFTSREAGQILQR